MSLHGGETDYPPSLRSLTCYILHCALYLLSGVILLKHMNQPSHVTSEMTLESWHLIF